MSEEVKWKRRGSTEPVSGPHEDHAMNVVKAYEFVKKIQKSLQPGMKVYVTGSGDLPESLLMICFIPPIFSKKGKFAAPIFLHQPYSQVKMQIEYYLNTYMKVAKDFWEKQEKQMELPYAANQ